MRVLIAPDCFTGTLTAAGAAEAMAAGWTSAAPDDDLTLVPLSDGGPGFLTVLATALDGTLESIPVEDPLGRVVPAALLLVDGPRGRTAYVESAAAAGLHLLTRDERDPTRTSSYGVGQLLDAALASGASRIVVGLGGSGTNDAGAGALAALGAGSRQALAVGGLALASTAPADLGGLAAARERFAGVELLAATDVDAPLLGFKGASAVYSPQKGATPEQAQALEHALAHFAHVVGQVTGPPRTDLLTGAAMRLEREAGAGAAGGLGWALLQLGARRVSGVDLVLDAVGLPGLVVAHDLVVTGEGSFDGQSVQGKVVAGVARAALEVGTPTVVIAGQVSLGRAQSMALGVAGAYAVAEDPGAVAAALADPVGSLSARTARVARTWSPRR